MLLKCGKNFPNPMQRLQPTNAQVTPGLSVVGPRLHVTAWNLRPANLLMLQDMIAELVASAAPALAWVGIGQVLDGYLCRVQIARCGMRCLLKEWA